MFLPRLGEICIIKWKSPLTVEYRAVLQKGQIVAIGPYLVSDRLPLQVVSMNRVKSSI
jgi:hypothetical protein